MSEKSQIFLTTFKEPFLGIARSNFYLVKMKDSLSNAEHVTRAEALDFMKYNGLD